MSEQGPSGKESRGSDAGPAAWARAWREGGLGERIALAGFALWCLAVGVALWAALGQPPAWLDIAALAVLWTCGLGYFLVLGAPVLFAPFYFLWIAVSPKRRAAEEAFGAEMNKAMAAMKAGDETEPASGAGAGKPFRLASLGRKPYVPLSDNKLPFLDWPLYTAAAVLVAALLLDGRFFLAALYLVPPLALYIALGGAWVWQRVVLRRA